MRNCFFATSHRCWVVLFSWSVNCKIWPKSPIQKNPTAIKLRRWISYASPIFVVSTSSTDRRSIHTLLHFCAINPAKSPLWLPFAFLPLSFFIILFSQIYYTQNCVYSLRLWILTANPLFAAILSRRNQTERAVSPPRSWSIVPAKPVSLRQTARPLCSPTCRSNIATEPVKWKSTILPRQFIPSAALMHLDVQVRPLLVRI